MGAVSRVLSGAEGSGIPADGTDHLPAKGLRGDQRAERISGPCLLFLLYQTPCCTLNCNVSGLFRTSPVACSYELPRNNPSRTYVSMSSVLTSIYMRKGS